MRLKLGKLITDRRENEWYQLHHDNSRSSSPRSCPNPAAVSLRPKIRQKAGLKWNMRGGLESQLLLRHGGRAAITRERNHDGLKPLALMKTKTIYEVSDRKITGDLTKGIFTSPSWPGWSDQNNDRQSATSQRIEWLRWVKCGTFDDSAPARRSSWLRIL